MTHRVRDYELIALTCCRCKGPVNLSGLILDRYERESKVVLCGKCEDENIRKAEAYPHIQAFLRSMGRPEYEIAGEIRIAHDDNAPANAVYRVGKRWVTQEVR